MSRGELSALAKENPNKKEAIKKYFNKDLAMHEEDEESFQSSNKC